ncbi:uncharacterized protein LOC133716092 [Rosa rugosa]|uniref:uncharacterized protein LOC133716092 n=1 Tax=Rosa rugosa TaxID=74645 RepID=UPI002B40735F|nr:uncharacterized protein LOC133716092 [Rosa rugosa]
MHSLFSPNIASRILATLLSRRAIHDRLCWSPEKRGRFTVKTTYWIARESVLGNALTSTSSGDPFSMLWKTIWRAKVLGKVQICIWRAVNNLLPTRAYLTTKGYTVELLSSPPLNLQQSLLPSINFKEWLLDCALNLNLATFEKLMMVLWSVWKNRNSKLWDGVAQILLYSMAWLEEFHKARDVHNNTGVEIKHTSRTCNNVANRLAAIAFESNQYEVWLYVPPNSITNVLQHDLAHAA